MDHGPAADHAAESAPAVIGRALDAYLRLGELGEEIADEWQYVTDLVAVHSADLRALAEAAPDRLLAPTVVAAVDAAIEEIGLIADPHRAIDWLSTFPQIIRVAVAPPAAAR
jgi:hypothetical protein